MDEQKHEGVSYQQHLQTNGQKIYCINTSKYDASRPNEVQPVSRDRGNQCEDTFSKIERNGK